MYFLRGENTARSGTGLVQQTVQIVASHDLTLVVVLRDEYAGDDAWNQFVSIFMPAWTSFQDKGTYVKKFDNEEFAIVLTASMGEHSISWFDKPCGALENRPPSDVMKNEIAGINILRTLLMRMPH